MIFTWTTRPVRGYAVVLQQSWGICPHMHRLLLGSTCRLFWPDRRQFSSQFQEQPLSSSLGPFASWQHHHPNSLSLSACPNGVKIAGSLFCFPFRSCSEPPCLAKCRSCDLPRETTQLVLCRLLRFSEVSGAVAGNKVSAVLQLPHLAHQSCCCCRPEISWNSVTFPTKQQQQYPDTRSSHVGLWPAPGWPPLRLYVLCWYWKCRFTDSSSSGLLSHAIFLYEAIHQNQTCSH